MEIAKFDNLNVEQQKRSQSVYDLSKHLGKVVSVVYVDQFFTRNIG